MSSSSARRPPRKRVPAKVTAAVVKAAGDPDASSRVSQVSVERARTCIEAAVLKSQGWSVRKIAEHFGWSSPAAADKAIKTGLALIPSESVHEVRRVSSMRLEDMYRKALEVFADPGPLVSQGKIIWRNEEDGQYFPDRMVQVRALEALAKVNGEWRKLHGADAPKRSLSMLASIPPEEIMAEIARLRAEGTGDGGNLMLGSGMTGFGDPGGDAGAEPPPEW